MRGTREGRRLFAGCLAVGLALGVVAAVGAAVAFHNGAEYVPCHPDDPQSVAACREVDLVGFELRSTVQAAMTVGVLVAVVGWVLSVVTVLYSSHRQPDPERRS